MKVSSVKKDASDIKFIPTIPPEGIKETSRISRQSSLLYTPINNVKYRSNFLPVSVLVNGGVTSEQDGSSGNGAPYVTQQVQEHYQNLPQKQQQQILAAIRAAQQPKSPVYHATPLEPYGALLKHVSSPKYEEKTILVTPKPIVEHHQGDQSAGEEAGDHSYYTTSNNAVGKHTEIVIPETKYTPLAYKSLHQHHQTLHIHDEHEEPKNVSQEYCSTKSYRNGINPIPREEIIELHACVREEIHIKC
jgi:hypothetical protein